MPKTAGVEAVDRALTVMGCFTPTGAQSLSLADLSAASGIYKSTILRLLGSLIAFGYVVRQPDGRYRLGPTSWRVGAAYRRAFRLEDVLRDALDALMAETGETASYYVRDGDQRVCLARREPPRAIRHAIVEGVAAPLDRGASGRLIRAWSPDATVEDAELRAAGFALSLGERDPDVAALAAPLFDADGLLLGALSVSGLRSRFDDAAQAKIRAALTTAQRRLSAAITG